MNKLWNSLIIFIVAVMSHTESLQNEEEVQTASLLVSKQILNKIIVQDMDIVVKYTIYNIGNGPAQDVELVEESFPKEFVVIGGQLNMKIDRISPQTNVSHTVILRSPLYGLFNFSNSFVVYKASENAPELSQTLSSSPGQWYIVNYRDYDKKFSPHLLDWTAFGIMTMPCLLVPFMLWFTSNSKYELIAKQRKEKPAKD